MSQRFKTVNPESVRTPFGAYAHGIQIPENHTLLMTSGQLGISKDDAIPEDATSQSKLCFESIQAILAELGAGMDAIVKVSAFVTDRAHFPEYMAVRDSYLPYPVCSTLLIVSGFTRPEFKVEVEVIAALPAASA